MKLLFDENLSPNLVTLLEDVFPDSAHVHERGLGSAGDDAIWEFAKERDYTIVTKDSDFQERSTLRGAPPKIIWLRVKNCASSELAALLRSALPAIARFCSDNEETCLVLGKRRSS